jgi:hypothetical protein
MSLRFRILQPVLALALFQLIPASGYGQALYSYTDRSGVKVFTSTAPRGPVVDLKITGVPLPTPVPEVPGPKTPYDPIIEKYAAKYQLDPALIRSIIDTESGFNERAVSSKGAQGLMQLMPGTAAQLGVRNPFDPEENIRGGVKYMRSLLDTFNNDLALSLAAYNAGENLVQRVGRIPNIRETHAYVRAITKKFGKKDPTYQAPPPTPPAPSTYRFVDEKGVLHLTNIPPVERSEPVFPLLTAPGN